MQTHIHKSILHRSPQNALHRLVKFASACVLLGALAASGTSTVTSSDKVNPKLKAMAEDIKVHQAEVKQLVARASSLSSQLAPLSRAHSTYARRLRVALDLLAKMEAIKKRQSNHTEPRLSEAEVAKREAVAAAAKSDADKLTKQLEALAAAHDEKQRQLQTTMETLRQASASQALLSRSKADLEEELARAEARIKELAPEKVALQKQVADLGEGTGYWDPEKGHAATIALPDDFKTVEFVCRKGQVALLDQDALFDPIGKAIQNSGGKITLDTFVSLVNNLKPRTTCFSLKLDGPYTFSGESGRHYKVVMAPEMGDAWEGADRLSGADSSFSKKLSSLTVSNTAIKFYVWDDSFDIYLKAVAAAQKAGFLTKWVAFDDTDSLYTWVPSLSGGSSTSKETGFSHGGG